MPEPAVPDPHRLGAAVAAWGNAARKNGRVALGIASVSFDEDELVELAVQGDIAGSPGVAVLTDRRLLLINEAAWMPMVEAVQLNPQLAVEGEADKKSATLTLRLGGAVLQVANCRDVELAKAFTARLRARATGQ